MKHTIRESEYRHMRIDTLMRFYSQLVDEGIIPPGGTTLTLKKNLHPLLHMFLSRLDFNRQDPTYLNY